MNTVLFVISNQPDNLGDVIQNRNIIRAFGRNGSVVIDDYYLKQNHYKSLGVHRGQLLSENRTFPNLRTISGVLKLVLSCHRQYDAVIRLPASVQYRGTAREIIREASNLLVCTLLRLKGIQIYQFGMTCDPSKLRGLSLQLERAKSKTYSIYGVRDIGVAEQLRGLSFHNLEYCPDVFYWDAPTSVYHDASSRGRNRPVVLFSFRETIPGVSGSDYTRTLMRKTSGIISALGKDTEIVFSYQVPMDREVNRRLHEEHKERCHCHFVDACLDKTTAEDLYSRCALLISNRQHCLLYGAKLGVPMLGLTDTQLHWKLTGALRDLGMPEYLVDIHETDEDIIAKCNKILEDENTVSKRLIAAVEEKRKEAFRFLRDRVHLEIAEEL